MGDVHICAPLPYRREVVDMACHFGLCGKTVPHLVCWFEWYGSSVTCLGCGENYGDGEHLPRPFARAWRQRSIREALRHLNGPVCPPPWESGDA